MGFKKQKENWVVVPDTNVQSYWACNDPDCKRKGNECAVTPDWYEENGTPVCECGIDMVYLRTEIKQ